jgi:hypothetical protein
MNDPERVNDTQPDAFHAASAEASADTDPSGGEVTEAGPTSPDEFEANRPEDSTDDFFRWLPTMWLWHRRRNELVQRRSSDGGDFVAYASSGRPMRTSGRVVEKTVQVLGTPSRESSAHGHSVRAQSSEASERDAPTVSLPKRNRIARKRALVVLLLLATAAAIVGMKGWTRQPVGKEAVSPPHVSAMPAAVGETLAKPVVSIESTAVSAAQREDAVQDPIVHTAEFAAGQKPVAAAAPAKELRQKVNWDREGPLGGDSSASRRPGPSATPPKEQYFEEP